MFMLIMLTLNRFLFLFSIITHSVGEWGDWEEFSECTATCGGGNQIRARECKSLDPENGEINCETETEHYTETVACNTQACPSE
jgi:hypothetical protein